MVTLNIYVIHYNKLTKRAANIERLQKLAQQESIININVITVNDHQPEDINVNNIRNLVKLEKLAEDENQFYQSFLKQLSIEILSNTFQHFKAIQHISKQGENEYGLVLEDDVIYSDKIFTQIVTLLNNIKTLEWDFLFLGQPSDQSVQQQMTSLLRVLHAEHEDRQGHPAQLLPHPVRIQHPPELPSRQTELQLLQGVPEHMRGRQQDGRSHQQYPDQQRAHLQRSV